MLFFECSIGSSFVKTNVIINYIKYKYIKQYRLLEEVASLNSEQKIKYTLEIVPSSEMPELSIIDYLMWAVQRNLLKGESRYFDALKDKYVSVVNLYEEE
jgi:hypothetical protein